MRRALDVEGLEPLVAADAMVDMDDQIALASGREASARKLAARRFLRGRARRSPRMSVSEMTARLSVSKPWSSGRTTRCGVLGSLALAACQ